MTRRLPVHRLITKCRKRAGLSKAQLARLLRKARSSITEWEAGLYEPHDGTKRRLVLALKMSTSEQLMLFGMSPTLDAAAEACG